jgi:quercetin dioxygenase-like cupin family protein
MELAWGPTASFPAAALRNRASKDYDEFAETMKRELEMPVVRIEEVPREPFKGGASYQTIVGDQQGSTPIRVGVQTSPPGYKTALHSHPYMETVTVLEGEGEAWLEGSSEVVRLLPGTTLVFAANQQHWFRATGSKPLVTLGVHASPHRLVNVHGE